MTVLTLCLIGGALFMALAGAIIFVHAVRRGAFDDLEDVKFQILREEDSDEQED